MVCGDRVDDPAAKRAVCRGVDIITDCFAGKDDDSAGKPLRRPIDVLNRAIELSGDLVGRYAGRMFPDFRRHEIDDPAP